MGQGLNLGALAGRQRYQVQIAAMKIVLLGTTGYHPSERRHTPCMLIAESGVMLDAGTAMFRAGR